MATRAQYEIIRDWSHSFPAGGMYESGRTVRADGNRLTGAGWGTRDSVLAVFLPAGRKRSRPVFLVSGDLWGSPGWGHPNPQWETRVECARAAADIGADVLLVPFSALTAANVDLDSIRPLEIRPDATWDEYEPVPTAVDVDGLSGAGYRSRVAGDELGTVRQGYAGNTRHVIHTWRDAAGRRYERTEYVGEWVREVFEGPRPPAFESWRQWPQVQFRQVEKVPHTWGDLTRLDRANTRWGHTCEPDPDHPGQWRARIRQHRLGDAVFLADVRTTVRRRRRATVADVVQWARTACELELAERYSAGRNGRRADEVEPASRILETRWDVDEPILETLQTVRRRRFVSSFDSNEPRDLYFLATLPAHSRARTVADAIMDLAPAAVHAAVARGKTVLRQGDVFAIPTNLTDADVYELAGRRRARLSQWASGARAKRGEIGYRRPLTAAERRHIRADVRKRWRRLFRQGVADAVAAGYAFPRTRRTKWDRRPPITPRYRSRDEYRHKYGTNALGYWNRAWAQSWEQYGRLNVYSPAEQVRLARILAIHGTSHSATEVAIGPGGATYIRGIMRHVPGLEPGRTGGRDHVNLRLGDGRTWYLAVRNTVPRNRDGRL